jgi:hypothetical protein
VFQNLLCIQKALGNGAQAACLLFPIHCFPEPTQYNIEGNQYLLLDEIIDWQKDKSAAVKKEDKYVYSHNGNQHYRKMTKGWKLCVKWKDGTTS